ncbi:MAG: nucleotide sugar dehydrogenase [Caldilineaceae bacterium]|nr:nucleotide sugar dehydrogenase [Caldilineaceae bacterium]
MNIAILGMGYVGCVSAACLAKQGHFVTGVDVNPTKVDLINQGKSPIVEQYLDEMIQDATTHGQLRAMTTATDAVQQSDISLICVGTPSREDGSQDLQHLQGVSRDIGRALRVHPAYHTVVIRSTLLPGTAESVVLPLIEEESDKQVGQDFGLCVNPEFMREGSAVEDYYNPPLTLIGAWDQRSGNELSALYENIEAPLMQTTIRVAEMLKFASNSFHALKVGFANEIGVLCKAMGIDSHEVMDLFMQDTRLNISTQYLRPGFAFGGSCLPKDVRAIVNKAKMLGVDAPILQAILPSNEGHIERAFNMVRHAGGKKVGILGLSFKGGTDDLRESPMVHLAEKLLGKGYKLSIYDPNVSLSRIIGANKQYIDQVLPHLAELLVTDLDEVMEQADVLLIGNRTAEFRDALKRVKDGQQVIDLVRMEKNLDNLTDQLDGHYQGICW